MLAHEQAIVSLYRSLKHTYTHTHIYMIIHIHTDTHSIACFTSHTWPHRHSAIFFFFYIKGAKIKCHGNTPSKLPPSLWKWKAETHLGPLLHIKGELTHPTQRTNKQSKENKTAGLVFIIIIQRERKQGGNSFGSPINGYLRIFLACVPTTGESIKRMNIYCLVRTVAPAETERPSCGWLVGRWVGMGDDRSIPLYNSDLCTALVCLVSPLL